MNLTRARRTDEPQLAEAIVRKLSPFEWVKLLLIVGGIIGSFFALRAQNEERWTNQHDRDEVQDRANVEVVRRLERIEDKLDRSLGASRGR